MTKSMKDAWVSLGKRTVVNTTNHWYRIDKAVNNMFWILLKHAVMVPPGTTHYMLHKPEGQGMKFRFRGSYGITKSMRLIQI